MKKSKTFSGALILTGAVLLAAAIGLSLLRSWREAKQRETLSEAVQKMQELLSEPAAGVPEGRSGEDMPRLEINGRDYIGLLELPERGIVLPVAADWDTGLFSFRPARYSGTLYGGTLFIGGSYSDICFAFVGQLDAGDRVSFTDVQGVRYTFTVSRITHNATIKISELRSLDTPLLLFAKNGNSYLVAHFVTA